MDKSQSYWEKELEALKSLSDDEVTALVNAVKDHDVSARESLLNGLQKRVYEAAAGYETEKIPRMDLFQEGNVALVGFLDSYQGDAENFLAGAMASVRSSMQRFASLEEVSIATGEALKTKLNVIDEITVRIAEQTGREPTAKEIADLLNTDEEEIKYLLGIALNAIREP